MTSLGMIDCPRCGRTVEASRIWLWVNGQGERLQLESGRIQQSGHVDIFDLPCGCKFNTELWALKTSTSVMLGPVDRTEVRVFIEAKIYLPEALR